MKKGHKMNNSNKKLHQPNKQSNQSTYVQFFFWMVCELKVHKWIHFDNTKPLNIHL